MIKFFRKIRQNMIKENKVSKYLLYAFGEIILVVIGILIALQLNTWRAQKQNSQIEVNYLKGILNDLNKDIYNLKETIQKDTLQFDAYTLLLKSFTDKRINKQTPEFIKAIGLSYFTHGFNENSIVFEDMKSSGKINLIKSDVLRFSILEYYNDAQQKVNYQNNVRGPSIFALKNEIFPKNIDLNSMVETFMMPTKWRSELDRLELSFFESKISSNEVKEFANKISILKGFLLSSLTSNEKLLDKAESLQKKINAYLSLETFGSENYLTSDVLNAIINEDIEQLKKVIPLESLNNCFETEGETRSLVSISIIEGATKSVQYFIDNGADIEQVCENKTPLMYAVKGDRLDMVKYLIEKGADLNKVSIKGKTALSYSIEYNRKTIEIYLKSLNPN